VYIRAVIVAQNIFTRALAQAATLHGSTQALAHELRVPENTLLRWMAGRAQMPLLAFKRVIAIVAEEEKRGSDGAVVPLSTPAEAVDFRLGEFAARCAGCGEAKFLSGVPIEALKVTTVLRCAACKQVVTYGELIAALATDAAKNARVRRGPRGVTAPLQVLKRRAG